ELEPQELRELRAGTDGDAPGEDRLIRAAEELGVPDRPGDLHTGVERAAGAWLQGSPGERLRMLGEWQVVERPDAVGLCVVEVVDEVAGRPGGQDVVLA